MNISPGEYFISAKGMIMHTMIGTCIAVAVHDPYLKSGGISTFLIPAEEEIPGDSRRKFGTDDLDALINAMVNNGSRIEHLQAKVFGGCFADEDERAAAKRNTDFAVGYLGRRNIELAGMKTGDSSPMKIYYYPDSFKIKAKSLERPVPEIEKQLKEYRKRLNLQQHHSRFGKKSKLAIQTFF